MILAILADSHFGGTSACIAVVTLVDPFLPGFIEFFISVDVAVRVSFTLVIGMFSLADVEAVLTGVELFNGDCRPAYLLAEDTLCLVVVVHSLDISLVVPAVVARVQVHLCEGLGELLHTLGMAEVREVVANLVVF